MTQACYDTGLEYLALFRPFQLGIQRRSYVSPHTTTFHKTRKHHTNAALQRRHCLRPMCVRAFFGVRMRVRQRRAFCRFQISLRERRRSDGQKKERLLMMTTDSIVTVFKRVCGTLSTWSLRTTRWTPTIFCLLLCNHAMPKINNIQAEENRHCLH